MQPSAKAAQAAVLPAVQGSQEAACAVYEAAIAAAAEKLPEDDKPFVHLTIQYAQFLLVVYRDAAGARAAYAAALEKLPRSQALWEGAIHLEQVVGAPVSCLLLLTSLALSLFLSPSVHPICASFYMLLMHAHLRRTIGRLGQL